MKSRSPFLHHILLKKNHLDLLTPLRIFNRFFWSHIINHNSSLIPLDFKKLLSIWIGYHFTLNIMSGLTVLVLSFSFSINVVGFVSYPYIFFHCWYRRYVSSLTLSSRSVRNFFFFLIPCFFFYTFHCLCPISTVYFIYSTSSMTLLLVSWITAH